MAVSIDPSLQFDLQQNYRRYLKYLDQYGVENDQLKLARGSKVWMVALVLLVFALASDFFLGASAALFGIFFYRVAMAWLEVSKAEEGREQAERWFQNKGFKLEGRVLFESSDEILENPIDPFDERIYR
jgi:hypothetical protein